VRRAFDIVMRLVTSLLGLLLIGIGCVWALQGLGAGPALILQGPMVDDIRWTFAGTALAVVGIAEIVWSLARSKV
jgi:hypothetical protein